MNPLIRIARGALLALCCCSSVTAPALAAQAADVAAGGELATFKAWLDSAHAGYGCDEGPARFRNSAVESAYPGRHFYYVLTYARGIQPPFAHSVTLVAEGGRWRGAPHSPGVDGGLSHRPHEGLLRQGRELAAAAVLVLASCGERRWSYESSTFKAKQSHGSWVCTYAHGSPMYTSRVTFDKAGGLASFEVGGASRSLAGGRAREGDQGKQRPRRNAPEDDLRRLLDRRATRAATAVVNLTI
jgi:hypothetical protein